MMNKSEQGKKNRKSGGVFELKVRKDLESKDWIVSKWQNNVEFAKEIGTIGNMKKAEEYPAMKQLSGKLIPAKRKYNPFNKVMAIGTGFPDFIAFSNVKKNGKEFFTQFDGLRLFQIIGVEGKSNGYLTKEEKEKCKWLIENNIFHKILIASKGKKRREIIYKNFEK